MPEDPNKLTQFWQELKRRKVVRVITIYAAAAFVIIELINNVYEPLRLPVWTPTLVIVLLCVGFIITVIVSWVYDITPEGIEKTDPAHKAKEVDKPVSSNSWKIASFISFVVIVALILFHILSSSNSSSKITNLETSIAVLPFENMSDDSEFAHLGDAMTDEIIMQLYKINEFEVRSRTSIMQYKDTEKGSPLIGEELKVNYLLEGSTQRYEDQVRIRIQLIHSSTDNHIWGDIFEGEWKDIFDIQINVAKQVARELKTVLSPKEVQRIENKSTENIEAYNLYLQGRYFWNQHGRDDLDKSIEYYKRAMHLLIPEWQPHTLHMLGVGTCREEMLCLKRKQLR
jgi:TolB-like protein